MGLFGGSFKLNKAKHSNKRISIEEQLHVLSNLGFRANHKDFIDWICSECSREEVESAPYYYLILLSLGGERMKGDNWERLSDDVYSFDMECVEDDDIYAIILMHLAAMSKGGFEISNTISIVDHDNCEASVSFIHNKTKCNWKLSYNGDWFDCEVVNKVNQLLQENSSSKFYYTCSPDQSLIVLFTSPEIAEQLNGIVSLPFILGASGITE